MTPDRILDMQDIEPPANGRALLDELLAGRKTARKPYHGSSLMDAQFRFQHPFSPNARVPRFYLRTTVLSFDDGKPSARDGSWAVA